MDQDESERGGHAERHQELAPRRRPLRAGCRGNDKMAAVLRLREAKDMETSLSSIPGVTAATLRVAVRFLAR